MQRKEYQELETKSVMTQLGNQRKFDKCKEKKHNKYKERKSTDRRQEN